MSTSAPELEQPAPAPTPPLAHALVKNALWKLATTVLLALLSLALVSVAARVLGMAQWGLLALFQAALAPLSMLDLGVGNATVKYAAEALGRRDREEVVRVVHTTLAFSAAVGLVGCLAVVALAPTLADHVFVVPPEQRGAAVQGFRLVGVSWLLSSLGGTYSGLLRACQRYDRLARIAVASSAANMAAGIGAVLAGFGVVAVVGAQVAVSAATTVAWAREAARELPGLRGLPRPSLAVLRRSLAYGSWQVVGMAGGLLTNWSDRYVLGVNFTAAVVGYYAATRTLQNRLYTAFYDMGEVLFPAVSHLQGAGQLEGARRSTMRAGWFLSTLFGVATVGLAAVGGDFLHLWIGPEAARRATGLLRLLSIEGVLGMAIVGPYFYALGVGRTRMLALSSVLTGAVVVGVGLALVPRLGLDGAGYGLIAGVATQWGVLVLMWRAWFSEDVSFAEFAEHVYGPPVVAIVGIAAAMALHGRIAHAPSWPSFFAEGVAAVLGAGALFWACDRLLPGSADRRRAVRALVAGLVARLSARRAA